MVDNTGDRSPWPALWALCVGFFMILVDTTIVSVATPTILADLRTDVDAVVWVTSAYLLAYAVPLLITGRLGDRFGPRRVYLVGLTIFTLASLWCGFTSTIGGLIAARVVQGLGAAVMMPQTMAVITRTFPAESRGRAMSPPTVLVRPHHKDAMVKTARPTRYTRRGPNRSPRRPVMSSGTA